MKHGGLGKEFGKEFEKELEKFVEEESVENRSGEEVFWKNWEVFTRRKEREVEGVSLL